MVYKTKQDGRLRGNLETTLWYGSSLSKRHQLFVLQDFKLHFEEMKVYTYVKIYSKYIQTYENIVAAVKLCHYQPIKTQFNSM